MTPIRAHLQQLFLQSTTCQKVPRATPAPVQQMVWVSLVLKAWTLHPAVIAKAGKRTDA